MKSNISVFEFLKKFPNEDVCENWIKDARWPRGIFCPFCSSHRIYRLEAQKRFKCGGCRKQFTVRTGSVLAESKVPLQKWLMTTWILTSHTKGISSVQLAKTLGVTQKTAWFLAHRIRQAFGQKKDVLSNTVEIDETFMGGESKNKHTNKKIKNEHGGTIHTQQPVLGMRERDGKVMAVVVPNRNKETILPIILGTVEEGSTIMTDEYTAYKDLKHTHSHFTVNHGAKEYVNKMAHTNGIENFWSHLKRGVDGIYHWVSKEHLQSYVDEFIFRFNARHDSTNEKFDYSLTHSTRLKYKELIAND